MKNLELMPTYENLISALENDILGRNKELLMFYELISKQDYSFCIALDGKWGSGKTFFIKHLEMLINSKNSYVNTGNLYDKECVCQLIGTDSSSEDSCMAVYYDAWSHDNATDPMMSIIYEIAKQYGQANNFNNRDYLKIVCNIIKAITEVDAYSILESLKSDNPFEAIDNESDLLEMMDQLFDSLMAETANRLIIIIDELDRCRPDFAVRLLERIKHYFMNPNVTFIFSVNLQELQHTIRKYYGYEFDAYRYLNRFFNLTIPIPKANRETFFNTLTNEDNSTVFNICQIFISEYGLELRDIIKYCDYIRRIDYTNIYHNSFMEPALKVSLIYIVPIAIGLKIIDFDKYTKFLDGNDSNILVDMYEEYWDILGISEYLGIDESTYGNDLYRFYDAALNSNCYENDTDIIKIGKCKFNRTIRDKILNTIGMLS